VSMIDLADYEKWKAKQSQANAAGAGVVMQSIEAKPDEVAGDMALAQDFAKTTGKPTPPLSLVTEHRSIFQQQIQDRKNSTTLSASPMLAEWLKKPENAAVARDDLEGLSWWETTLGATGNAMKRGLMSVPQGLNQYMAFSTQQRALDREKSFGELYQEARKTGWRDAQGNEILSDDGSQYIIAGARWLDARYADLIGTNDYASAAAFQQRAGKIGASRSAISRSPAGVKGAELYSQFKPTGNLADDARQLISIIADDPGAFLAFMAETAIESVPNIATGAAVSAATRNPAAGAVVIGGSSAIGEMGSAPAQFLQEKGYDISTREGALAVLADKELLAEARKIGNIRAVLALVIDTASGSLAGQQIMKSPVGNAAAQSFAQALIGGGGEATKQAASGQEFNLAEVVLEGLAEFTTAPIEVAGLGIGRVRADRAKAKSAETRQAFFQELSGQAVNSKLRTRLPQAFQDFLKRATENGPVENVYVPAREFVEYFQGAGIDPFALVDDMDWTSTDDLNAALATGGDVQIPTAVYAAKMAGSDHDAFLMDNMRFSPDDMTAREAREFNARAQDAIEEAFAEAERMRADETRYQSYEADIYDTMVSRLRAAGRSTDVATNEAMLYPAFYRVMAEKSGLGMEAFLQRYPLPNVQGDVPQGMQLKNSDALNRTLAEARALRSVAKDKRQGLLDWISDYGGIADRNGELKARDAMVIKRGKGKKTLRIGKDVGAMGQGSMFGAGRSAKQYGPDDVARAAIEAGFMADDPLVMEYKNAVRDGTEVPDITKALWNAIDRELAGEKVASEDDILDQDAIDRDAMLQDLEAYLNRFDLTLDDSDEAIRAAIEADQSGGGKMYGQDGEIATESKAFKKWFGDSKVVDADGKPLVVYHGSNKDTETLKIQFQEGIFFTDNTDTASDFAAFRSLNDAITSDGGVVYPVYLSIQNPLIHDMEGRHLVEDEDGVIERAKSEGRDGVIFKNAGMQMDATYNEDGELEGELAGYGSALTPDELETIPGGVSDVFVAFTPTQIKSVNNRGTFDPADPRILYQSTPHLFSQSKRGSIQFPKAGVGNGDTVINLFRQANLSTFIHESGHYFLSVMQDLAARGEIASAEDFDAIKGWWRENAGDVAKDAMRAMPDVTLTPEDVIAALDNGTTGDVMKDAAIDVGMQEQFARGFETYIMEGKAPSEALRGAFEKFRAWLLSVYKKLTGTNVTISDELRGVFDRMLATDQEIAAARAKSSDEGPLFATAEEMGLSPEDYAAFKKLAEQAKDQAAAKLLAETMAPIRREQEKWYKEERAAVREKVEREINAYRQYRALEWMGNRRWLGEGKPAELGDLRLSKVILVERYGEGVLKTLPRGTQPVYAAEGGVDPDEAAGLFGYSSGDELVQALEKAPPRKQAIEDQTDREMFERHGDALRDGRVEELALEAVHGDKRGRVLALELKALTDVAGADQTMTYQEAREIARQTLTRSAVRDAVNAGRYLAAERKAGQEAQALVATVTRTGMWVDAARRAVANKARAAVRAGDPSAVADVAPKLDRAGTSIARSNEAVAKLLDAKRRQLLNHAMYTEARKIAAEVEKAEALVTRLQKKTTRQKLAGDYLEAIDELIQRYDFRRMSGKAEERRGALLAYVERMKAEGRENELAIPDKVLNDAARTPYMRLSVEHLRGVVDSLKNIAHTAKLKKTLQDAQSQRELDAVVAEITDAFDRNLPKKPPGRVRTNQENRKNSVRQFLDLVLNAGTLLREIDGFEDLGPAFRNLKAPIDAAMNRLAVRRKQAATDLDGLYAVYTKDERRRMAVREFIPEINASLSKWERISVALNTGNDGNFQRLTDTKVAGGFTEDQVVAILAGLDERDARFVQSVWDYLETFRSDIEAREKRVTGVTPKWVEPTTVKIAGVDLTGGYYPLKYDPVLSQRARDDQMADVAKSMQAGRFGKAQTKNGHLKERAQSSGRAIELDIAVLHKHIQTVVYDIELSEPVNNSWRVLQDERVRDAFMQAGKSADFDALEIWLRDVAEGEIRSAEWVGRTARRFKSNFTAAKLAFNIGTVAMQITGVSQSMVVVGKKDFLRGVQASFRPGIREEIAAKSAFMSERSTTFNKDIFDLYNDPKLGPVTGRWSELRNEWIAPAGFWLMTKVQSYLVDVPTWLAGYQQGLRKFGNDEAKAIQYADDIVKRSQASGLFSDRSAIERGSSSMNARQNDLLRLFTTLGSYMFAKFNVAYERSVKAGRKIQNEGASLASVKEALSWSLDMAFLFTLEAVMVAAIRGRLPDEEDEDDDWATFVAKETALSFMSTIPFVRDAASVFSGFSGGGAYGSMIEEISKPFLEVAQGEADKPLVKSVINATGLATGLPSTAINRLVDAGWRQAEGDDVSPAEYLLGRAGR
jgi:hypothetical protein